MPTMAASPNHNGADFLPSSVVSTVAANTAALACPLGKLLVDGASELFKNYDAIILPTVPSPAFLIGDHTKDSVAMFLADIYTVYANLVGIPAISIPLYQHSSGLPFGLQIMCAPFEEVTLLKLSTDIQKLHE